MLLSAAAVTMLAAGFSTPGASLPGPQGSGTTAAASAEGQLMPTATYSVSPQTTGVMVAEWLHYGGLQQITVLNDDLTRLGVVVEAAGAKMQREANKHGLVTDTQARSALAPAAAACVSVMDADRSAEAYFPIPSTGLQSQWQSMLTGLSADARRCTASVSKANGAQFLASVKGMGQEGRTLYDLATQLKSVAGRL